MSSNAFDGAKKLGIHLSAKCVVVENPRVEKSLSFTLTWLRKMYVDKPENVLSFAVAVAQTTLNKCIRRTKREGDELVITIRNWIFIWLHQKWMLLWKIEISSIFPARNRFSKNSIAFERNVTNVRIIDFHSLMTVDSS